MPNLLLLTRRAGALLLLGLAGLLLTASPAAAQVTLRTAAVRASAVVRTAPAPQIRLVWTDASPAGTNYLIWRKLKTATSWGTQLATVAASALAYDDNAVAVGAAYEYRLRSSYSGGEGYVYAGLAVAPTENRGTLVLVVDNTNATYLASDINLLVSDLRGDGWQVRRHDVAPTDTPPVVKALIKNDYLADPTQVKAVFLLGHVAVPYSGDLYPDGHANHEGAWPADAYYGDMAGTWTDATVNTSVASRPENRNVPGDGKFDQTSLPFSTARLQVGRVDMSRLPAFALSERDLLRRYLSKDHAFRHGQVAVAERGLITDAFGYFSGEAFANNGWRNFSALVGEANITSTASGTYFPTLASQDYLLTYACGGGSYTSVSGTGNTTNFTNQPLKGVFGAYFGSYFGDWDNSNNFLRASIAGDGYSLTSAWAGRPNWEFHHMGLGETVGYAALLSQAPGGLYVTNYGTGYVHVALMGDPSLRLHPLAPPTALVVTTGSGGSAALAWSASPAAGVAYHVYRAATADGPFVRLTPAALTGTTFTDPAPLAGPSTYLVRAVALKSSPSGSYYNLSQGVFQDFATPLVPATTSVWLGTAGPAWDTPTNWSTGRVPTAIDMAEVPAATPAAPLVPASTTGTAYSLVLAAGASLTVAAGGTLALALPPILAAGPAGAPTSLTLATGTAAAPGGTLACLLPAPTSWQLPAGATLAVGNYAELRLRGSFGVSGGTAAFGPKGRLTFTHGASNASAEAHTLAGPDVLTLGVLALADGRDELTLAAPVQVLGRVENLGVIASNGHLTLLSALGQQGVLAPVAASPGGALTLGRYRGAVQVQVFIDGSRNAGAGYRHLSAPVGEVLVSSLGTSGTVPVVNPAYNTVGNAVQPFPTVFGYREGRVDSTGVPGAAGFDQGWVSPGSLGSGLVPGRGYTVRLPPTASLHFDGAPLTAATFSLSNLRRGTAAAAGWQLLGNPYAAPLDWDQLTANGNRFIGLDRALYVSKSSGPYSGTYASYLPGTGGNPGTGVNGGAAVLPVGQAFFVRTSTVSGTSPSGGTTAGSSTGGYLTISLSDLAPDADAANVQRTTADPRPHLLLTLRNAAGTQAHQTAVYFQAGATPGPDADYDAPYLPGAGQPLALTTESGGTRYAINGLPALTGADVQLPLQLSAATAGPYALVAEELANLPTGYHAYLHDALAGTYTDLAATSPVALTLPAAPVEGRYALLFTAQTRILAVAPAALAALVSLAPNPAHGTATLWLPLALRGGQPTPVEISNALGQVLRRATLPPTADALTLPLDGLAPGLYLVQAHTAVGGVSRRLVVE